MFARADIEKEVPLSEAKATQLSQTVARARDIAERYSVEHKDLHASVSRIGKTIDRVRLSYRAFASEFLCFCVQFLSVASLDIC